MTRSSLPALLKEVFAAECIPAQRAAELVSFYDVILNDIVTVERRRNASLVLGICGSQGSGKSTLARVLAAALDGIHGLSVAVLSLDDLYLSGAERARLAQDVHPLLRTRGVPGTHDVGLGIDVIRRLLDAGPDDTTLMPRFEKALDEPRALEQRDRFHGRPDIVIFEGWCVGALPQPEEALVEPVNALERESDPDGQWRRFVNHQLAGPYQALFGLIDHLLLLRVPSFDCVYAWRRHQERKLAEKLRTANTPGSVARVMSDEQLKHFIMHYERLTRYILAEMPARADVIVDLDEHRRITALALRPQRG